MDEARIQAMVDEIVARVTAQVGHVPETPLEAVRNPPPGFAPPPSASSERAPSPERERARRRDVDIPRGRRGVFPDVDAAVRAAQQAFAQNEAAPLESRRRWVQAMRDVARKHVGDLARFAVEETGYGRVDDKLKKN